MSQPLDRSLPQYDGANMAPVKPLEQLKEKGVKATSNHYVADALKEKYDHYIKYDEPTFREIVLVGQMTALFIEGKQILDWNPYSKAFVPRKVTNSDPNKIKAVNQMQYLSSQWQAKWGSSNPDVIVEPLSNDDRDITRARKANAVVDSLEKQFYGPWYNYHEGLLGQVFGWYGNRVRPCNKSGKLFKKPLIGEKEVKIGSGYGKCYDCEHSGTDFEQPDDGDMPSCPECGSKGVTYEPPVTQMMPMVTGHEDILVPNLVLEQLPFPACRWNPKFRAEDSSWFIYEQEIDENVVQNVVGKMRIPDGESGNKFGLDVMRELGITGSPVGGRTSVYDNKEKNRRTTVVSEMSLSPDDLYDIKINGSEETVSGEKLEKGKRMSDMFPEGCTAIFLNGTTLVGLYREHHSDSVTSGVYHMKTLSGTGRGVADAVEIQKRFNREDSANLRHMETRARPATLHMAGAISPADRKLLGQPDVDIPVNMQNFPEVRSLSDIIMPLQGQSIPGDAFQYTYQWLQDAMQRAYHTTGFGGATPSGVKNTTATYAEISDQNSDELFTPALSIKGEMRVETARKAFEMWCKTHPVPTPMPLSKPTRGGNRVINVSAADVEGEYSWSYVPGSELPSNKLSKRKDSMTFYSLFGGVIPYLQVKGQFPQEIAEIERTFDMDISLNDYDEVGQVCRTRFEYAKGLMEQAEQLREGASQQFGVDIPPVDPSMIMDQVKPTMLVTESKLQEKALWFSNLLDTDEGQEMDDDERNLVDALIKATTQLAKGQALEVATMANEVETGSQAPAIEAQTAAQGAMSAQEHQQALEQQAQSAGIEEAKMTAQQESEAAKNTVEHQQTLQKQELQSATQLELGKMQQESKREGQNSNPK